MHPLLDLNKLLKKKRLLFFLGVALLFIFLASVSPFIKSPAVDTLKSPLNLLTLIRREISGIIFYHRNLIQNEELKQKIDLLKQKINALNEAVLENQRLNSLLSFKQKSSYKLVAARVIGRSLDTWSSVIIIDKGRNAGIRPGMVVITYLGLVGRVIETAATISKVMLINDPNLAVSCIVQRSRQEGLASGTLGNYLVMKYLPREADIKVSDIIITSGLTDMYPKGLLVGIVVHISEELSGLMLYANIKPAVNLSSLEEVLVIIP